MAIEKTRTQIIANIWQALAQSGVDLSSVKADQQQKLVGKIADEMMVTLNNLLDDAVNEIPQLSDEEPVDEMGEKVLWEGRPFLSLIEKYKLTSERLKVSHGLVGRQVENFELIRVQDIDFKQNLGERVFGTGDITIRGADPSNPVVILRNVSKPEEVYEILRRTWLEARKRHGLQFREQM
jgi:hypothetical protein